MQEIESLTSKLAKTRNELWSAQDKLKVSEQTNDELQARIKELETARHDESEEAKVLRENNAQLLQSEAELREAMTLMKTVFTRTNIKSKEEQETIVLLTEERNLLLEENARLRSMPSGTSAQKHASVLATSLEATRAEVSEFRLAQLKSEQTIRKLRNELIELRESHHLAPTSKYTAADRKEILDKLERRVISLVDEEEAPKDSATDESKNKSINEVVDARNFARNFCVDF